MASHVVTAPMVVAEKRDETYLYAYEGDVVESAVLAAGELGRLVELGALAPVVEAKPAPVTK